MFDGFTDTSLVRADPVDIGASILQKVAALPSANRGKAVQSLVAKAVQQERARTALVTRQLQQVKGQIGQYQRIIQQLKGQINQVTHQARLAGWKGASTLVPLDSGSTGIVGDGLTPTFVISPGVSWRYLGLVVAENVANNFVLNVFTVAGFPNISQGVNVSGNGANAGLGLGPFVLNSTSPMVLPFAGKMFSAQTPLTLQARSITNPLISSRFVAVVLLGLNIDNVCNPTTGRPTFRMTS